MSPTLRRMMLLYAQLIMILIMPYLIDCYATYYISIIDLCQYLAKSNIDLDKRKCSTISPS